MSELSGLCVDDNFLAHPFDQEKNTVFPNDFLDPMSFREWMILHGITFSECKDRWMFHENGNVSFDSKERHETQEYQAMYGCIGSFIGANCWFNKRGTATMSEIVLATSYGEIKRDFLDRTREALAQCEDISEVKQINK